MANTYLSFGSIAKLHNNNPTTVSPIGELSNRARTYAKDPSVYSLPDDSPTVLFNFYSFNDAGEEIEIPQAIAERQIAISDWLYDQGKRGNLTDDPAVCLANLRAKFTVSTTFTSIGEMVTDSVLYLPSMIKGQITELVGGETILHNFTIWFAEEYFRREYPYKEFTIIHPVPLNEIDLLMTMDYKQLSARFLLENPLVISARIKEATDNSAYPYTASDVQDFDIVDEVNEQSIVGYWRYLYWGNGIDTQEDLFEQIRNEILGNSNYPLADWENKIPDLFSPVEYYAIPDFTSTGILNLTNATATLSPVLKESNRRRLIDLYITPMMTEEHIIESLAFIPFMYKSAMVGFVGKLSNREGYVNIGDVYSDYQLISSSDFDFGRMSPETREFIMVIEELLAAAETVTATSLVPMGIARVIRGDKVYVAKTADVTKIVMLTRHQLIADGIIVE